ncbi:helix-turn-helix domain-containing protein [Aquimarina sp. BL5]|uniref:tetratricopeptide repeat protein n=1 Tax=Aquimarina sp. BL5 TaxID=1714860 RepID=UPI000E4DCDA8|nr:tetratricopeptide repeat protein [Aquimarina sp. BL5]AXT50167.1 helix-turn-helix domain-containing protein [Aquimarina sp. BL5]RKM96348.1 helix-turn-helix domain-containing protein [Aquimarina sp. BL5]
MKMKCFAIIFLIILSLSKHAVIAQDNYIELKELVTKEKVDSLKMKIAKTYLDRAISKSDTLNRANAYFILSEIILEDKVAYIDSIIAFTEKKNYFRYPALGYLYKGNIKFELGDYIEALEFYVKASESAKKSGNNRLYLSAKFNIGLLKNTSGDREEAQTIFAEYIEFLEQNPKYINTLNYNRGLFALADSYIHTKKLELAEITIDKGIKKTIKTGDSVVYSYILVTSGIHQYLLNNYQKAIDSLQKGKKIIQKLDPLETRIATCDYYIGRSYKDLGEEEKSISYFKKTDTILRKTKDIIPDITDVYDYLRTYSKSKNDYELQIEYINMQLELDSIKHANQVYLTRNITRKYDAAELISEKERLIKQFEKDTFLKDNTITFLIILSIILVLIAIYGLRKSYLNKIRFQKLLEQQKKPKTNQLEVITKISNDLTKKEEIDIPSDVIETILKKLHDFEDKNQFSKKHYTLNSLAKELNTNSAYLSKIINVYKNVNFATYLNNLRIDFAVDQLSSNKSLRSYTIQAIAEEVGFKNAQSFSSAFHKKTGIYPSYFIKHINN